MSLVGITKFRNCYLYRLMEYDTMGRKHPVSDTVYIMLGAGKHKKYVIVPCKVKDSVVIEYGNILEFNNNDFIERIGDSTYGVENLYEVKDVQYDKVCVEQKMTQAILAGILVKR